MPSPMNSTASRVQDMVDRVLQGDRRAAARLITLLENRDPIAVSLLAALYPHTGQAFRVGITGPPGAGKSSLVDRLIGEIRQEGLQVGVVAVDPASPFSGGAILGDRVRMITHADDPGVFIRSMSARGQLGGLALATQGAAQVLDAMGSQVVLVETVGVGQSEVAIAQASDCTVLVLPPGLGDGIQAIKAGIMEVPDVFVVNKADLPGAAQVAQEIQGLLAMEPMRTWMPPILQTRSLAPSQTGVAELWQSLAAHRKYLVDSGDLALKRQHQVSAEIRSEAEGLLRHRLDAMLREAPGTDIVLQVAQRELSPHAAARQLLTMLDKEDAL